MYMYMYVCVGVWYGVMWPNWPVDTICGTLLYSPLSTAYNMTTDNGQYHLPLVSELTHTQTHTHYTHYTHYTYIHTSHTQY